MWRNYEASVYSGKESETRDQPLLRCFGDESTFPIVCLHSRSLGADSEKRARWCFLVTDSCTYCSVVEAKSQGSLDITNGLEFFAKTDRVIKQLLKGFL